MWMMPLHLHVIQKSDYDVFSIQIMLERTANSDNHDQTAPSYEQTCLSLCCLKTGQVPQSHVPAHIS